jgi:hypothetical protein
MVPFSPQAVMVPLPASVPVVSQIEPPAAPC